MVERLKEAAASLEHASTTRVCTNTDREMEDLSGSLWEGLAEGESKPLGTK